MCRWSLVLLTSPIVSVDHDCRNCLRVDDCILRSAHGLSFAIIGRIAHGFVIFPLVDWKMSYSTFAACQNAWLSTLLALPAVGLIDLYWDLLHYSVFLTNVRLVAYNGVCRWWLVLSNYPKVGVDHDCRNCSVIADCFFLALYWASTKIE